MKGSFIIVFLWVEFMAILHGSTLRAQQVRPHIPVINRGVVPAKNNFTSFTRKYTKRGNIWAVRNGAFLNHPDANFTDRYSPANEAVELFEKRTVDTKFYINQYNPSIVYAQRSSSPMHFQKNGQWITIDSRLEPKGALMYEASNQEDPLGFDIQRKSSYIITGDGRTYFNDWKLYGKNADAETLLASADWTHYTAGDDGIAIKNIFPGIDAEMKVSRGSIKTNFIVHTNNFSSYQTLLFRDSFLNGQDGHFSFSNGNTGNGLVSSADFRVSATTSFHVKEGVMYQKEKPSSSFQFIPYYIDHNKLTLAVSRDFLNAPDRTGDIIIDPQVQDVGVLLQNTITGSHSNLDCSLDTACEYDFTVPAPPGAKLIDAQFSFAFTANDPCVGQDGAFSFASGTCVSQKYVGTSTGPGIQNFPNQSILTSGGANLAGCLPNPVCGLLPQNIPFSFFFYRKCHGPEGCDGSCIAASEDLTITLVGRTFDSVSVTASPLNSCPGAPVTLTARGYFGVAPYVFTWPGLPQFNGDSVITVNPTTNTNYTVQVSDQCIVPVSLPILKSISVNVFPKPPTPVLTSNSPICAGGQLILSVPPAVGTIYFISNPGTGVGGGQYASIAVFNNVTAAYAGTWIAVATDLNGCISDTGRTTVVVNPTLTPTATITSSATNICTGTLVTFNATAINAGTSPTYQWLLNSQKVGTNSPTYSGSSFANNDAISCIVSANGPCAGGFDVSNIIQLQVSAPVTPTFNSIGPLCQNSTPPTLPSTSKEAITGTWSPAIISTSALGTVTYTFTPATGSCANPATLSIAIVGSVSPTFPTITNSYCQNASAPTLPLVSKEGITGTWSPAAITTTVPGTTTYTFTPTTGSCATPLSLNITIVGTVSPTFPTIANSYCQNAAAPALPLVSKEGITGTWSPTSINTSVPGTATYIFTPIAGSCSTLFSLNITIVGTVTPTFNSIGPLCQNSTPPTLPLTSKEGIAGTWSPASISTSALGTVTYTFTPATGSCSPPASLIISIVGSVSPTFPTITNSYCQNATAPTLPPVSKEGITGTWSPVTINTTIPGTTTYTFTPAVGSCATPASLNITIVGTVSPTFPTITNSYCQNTATPALPLVSKEGINGTWIPSSINTSVPGTSTYTFTPSTGSCASPVSLLITIVGTVTPTFNAIGPLCQNSTPPLLPLTSKEGVTGTWSPASINTSALGTVTYTFTPAVGSCSPPVSLNIVIVGSLIPTFNSIGPLCQNSTPPILPLTSKEGITGTWNPSSINTTALGTLTYTFTPSAGSCSTPASLNITIVNVVAPTFPTITNSYCQNAPAPALPLVSKEGVTGTWNPASVNMSVPGTTTYTFTPTAGSCATPASLNITIVGTVSPTFPTIANVYCQNSTPPALPPTSKEGISGTWSPVTINTSVPGTATYSFTPTAGSCAIPFSINITIVNSLTLVFDPIGPLCQNSTPPALPPTSKEGITGTWSPAIINTSALGTATYTFTPTAGSCATPASLKITIVGTLVPTFNAIGPLCQNSTPPALPLVSKEQIAGTWSPASINTSVLGTAMYTFTPSAGSCAIPATLSIAIVSSVSPTFNGIGPLCQNSTPPVLPLVSKEGITGTWNPASVNMSVPGTATFTFTPAAGSCATPTSLNITIVGIITPTFPAIANVYCHNSTAPALPLVSAEGITGTWSPASINTSVLGTATYSFTPTAGSCSTPVSINITIVNSLTLVFDPIGPLCQNSTAPALPPESKEGITGTWSPAIINTSAFGTVTYTFTPVAGSCASPAFLNITIVGTVLPTFPNIANSYCQNTTVPALPSTSTEGITGTWSPAIINTSVLGTSAYIFTPSTGSCANPASLNIIIVSTLTPTFDAIGPLCHNSTPPVLPQVSKEGITGTWSPASIGTSVLGTSTYQFTPSSIGNCATPASMSIAIVNTISPSFPTIGDSYCLNDIAPTLPATSKEGIDGTWNPSSINTANAGSTVYTFTPTGGQCGVSAQMTITVNPPPVLTMGPDLTIADGASTTLNVLATGNIVSYQWQPSTGLNNASIKDPVASPSSTTTYTLLVIDDNNCETSGNIKVTVSGRANISVPNAFSPNGDGINDTWVITNLSVYPGATVDVFNRYGQRVFHTENANKAWDGTYNGKPLPIGTYYYIIDLKNNEKKTAGSVTIFK